jgi:hypothetical protein
MFCLWLINTVSACNESNCRQAWLEWNSTQVRPADSQPRRTTRTNDHIYTLLPPGGGQLATPKHVEV